ncbi:MAG: 2,4-dihydroxyhept-2-ene-1,7-dioic acid aldolase [Desulfovibrio sp.]|nr:2,4-dihydroxyhept-2-ene-1,7-dioic acid aldolase [Desulfovibrio sp.]
MEYIRSRALKGEFLAGAWCNMASPISVEISASLGYDWILIDQEHGPGDHWNLLHQVHAASRFPATVVVRLPWADRILVKRALDIGVGGVMIPYVQTAEQAKEVVSFCKYPPVGERGVASSPRCAEYNSNFKEYFACANEKLLTVAQIETGKSVENVDAIAAVPGIDVLFVGPLDLSINTNLPGMYDDAVFVSKLASVVNAAKKYGKAAGILLSSQAHIPQLKELGYTFIACGTDSGAALGGLKSSLEALKK